MEKSCITSTFCTTGEPLFNFIYQSLVVVIKYYKTWFYLHHQMIFQPMVKHHQVHWTRYRPCHMYPPVLFCTDWSHLKEIWICCTLHCVHFLFADAKIMPLAVRHTGVRNHHNPDLIVPVKLPGQPLRNQTYLPFVLSKTSDRAQFSSLILLSASSFFSSFL